jgi:hypothetical protein
LSLKILFLCNCRNKKRLWIFHRSLSQSRSQEQKNVLIFKSLFNCKVSRTNQYFNGENQCWAVLTFLWEPIGSSSYIMLWEPDQFSIFSGGLVRPNQVIKIFIFSKFTRYSTRVVLAYIITHVQFSQPSSHFFWKLKFNLIII